MAFKEVELTEEERAALSGTFFKFNAIGDRLAGIYVGKRPTTGIGANSGKEDYTFKTKNAEGAIEQQTLTPPTSLAQQLKKAERDGLLVAGRKVVIQFVSEVDVGKESPMKQFKLLVDDGAASPANAGTKPAAPKPAPKPAPVPDDFDIPL